MGQEHGTLGRTQLEIGEAGSGACEGATVILTLRAGSLRCRRSDGRRLRACEEPERRQMDWKFVLVGIGTRYRTREGFAACVAVAPCASAFRREWLVRGGVHAGQAPAGAAWPWEPSLYALSIVWGLSVSALLLIIVLGGYPEWSMRHRWFGVCRVGVPHQRTAIRFPFAS